MLLEGFGVNLARYRCPDCRGAVIRLSEPLKRRPRCPRCSQLLQPATLLPAGIAIGLSVAATTLLLTAAPDLLKVVATLAVRYPLVPGWMQRFDPPPDPRRAPLLLLRNGLVRQLAEGDARWTPRVEYLSDGGTRYFYHRRPGEPPLSLEQIRALIDLPPSFDQEREAVVELLRTLQDAGVQLDLTKPYKPAAAAEWDGSSRTLRVDPSVVKHGTLDFARVLNHEAIHVAQSCYGGGLRATPKLLGIDNQLRPELAEQLEQPTYKEATATERSLEAEAYANQNRLGLGAELVGRHCPLRS
jgi:hypothetical protein